MALSRTFLRLTRFIQVELFCKCWGRRRALQAPLSGAPRTKHLVKLRVDLDMATILRQNLNPRSFRKLGVQHLSVDHGSLRFHTRVTP